MTPHDPASPVPPPLGARRDPGDAWVVAPDGERYWGRFGAAGLLVHDPDRGVLLQHRAVWSHHGGTWGIPGGALHEGEGALDGALREAREEAGVGASDVEVVARHVVNREVWTYTTVVARARVRFEAVAGDAESLALEWVPVAEVDALPLHHAFFASWPALRVLLGARPTVVVDGANVVGSVPDGWWRDRAAAAQRLAVRLAGLVVPGQDLDLPAEAVAPVVELVVEGRARGIAGHGAVRVVEAPGEGDDAIVERARAAAGSGVLVVTSDRALSERCRAVGAQVRGARWLLELVGPAG